jgi:sulfonate transport system ATP-binding protein
MLRLDRVFKRFPNGYLALDDVTVAVRPGEILGVVGGSGAGKSTLLRLMSGLEPATSGAVTLNDEPVTGPRSEIGMVYQEPRLMPWLNLSDNVQFGLKRVPKRERQAMAAQALERVGLSRVADALPRELSGGMAQRVAIARALVAKPSVMLLDEPFSALDAFTRMDLQDHVLEIWAYDRPTMVLVTHDIEEALALSDRVVVMLGHPGRIHGAYTVDLPRPRARTSPQFQEWKEDILHELHITLHRATETPGPTRSQGLVL